GEAGKGAAMPLIDVRMASSDPADAELQDDRFFPRDLRAMLLAPSESRFDDPAFGDVARIVAPIDRQVLARAAEAVAEIGVGPAQPSVQRFSIGVDQQLVGIETVAIGRIVRTVDTIAVKQV